MGCGCGGPHAIKKPKVNVFADRKKAAAKRIAARKAKLAKKAAVKKVVAKK